eukprot:gene11586-7981_t
MGAILFITIRSRGDTLQVIRQVADGCSRQDLRALKETLRMGDIIGATGSPGRTKKGELSLYATQVQVLSPYVCADQSICPQLNGFSTVADPDIRYRYRFLDMMTNPDTIRGFQKRHAVLKALRNFLDERDFTEVETPMLHEVPSGANAKPFTTHHEANDTTLYLRVAPELYLKQCVVGGMERVYEIGRVFRNEDADRSHNPEFTSCECYAAYQTYEDLIPFTEDLLRRLAVAANGTTKLTVESVRTKEAVEINFDAPFRRVSAYDAVQAEVGVKLPPADELHSPRGLAYLSAILLRYNIPLPSVRTASKMFDKLISYFITDRVVEPTFVMDHPVCMSPLAKAHDQRKGLSERFELFINGVEYCNAYSELNDPVEQYRRFQQQLVDKQTGDEEAMPVDETFLKALQAGLPPTAGWGLGVDRLMTLLQQSATIRDTIMCPLLRTDATSRDGKRRRKAAGQFPFSPRAATFALHCLEEEMRRRGMPSKGCEAVRELHHFILQIQRHTKPIPLDTAEVARRRNESRKWAENMTMILLQVFCDRQTETTKGARQGKIVFYDCSALFWDGHGKKIRHYIGLLWLRLSLSLSPSLSPSLSLFIFFFSFFCFSFSYVTSAVDRTCDFTYLKRVWESSLHPGPSLDFTSSSKTALFGSFFFGFLAFLPSDVELVGPVMSSPQAPSQGREIYETIKWNGWGELDRQMTLDEHDPTLVRHVNGEPIKKLLDFLYKEVQGGEGAKEVPPLSPSISLKEAIAKLNAPLLNEPFLAELRAALEDRQIRTDGHSRLCHIAGKNYRDLWRIRKGMVEKAPDCIVLPSSHKECVKLMELAHKHNVVLIPFGGGTNVTGGVEANPFETKRMIVSVDMRRMNRMLHIDVASRLATFETGILGPDLDEQLFRYGFMFGHDPDSYTYSTLGGWIGARGSGAMSNQYGDIEDMVICVKVVTPTGVIETPLTSRPCGVDLNGLFIGSEGAFGIITEATIKLEPLPEEKHYTGYLFPTFEKAFAAFEECTTKGIHPCTMRLYDEDDFAMSRAMSTAEHGLLEKLFGAGFQAYMEHFQKWNLRKLSLVIVGFEGTRQRVALQRKEVHDVFRKHYGINIGKSAGASWQEKKYDLPYIRDFALSVSHWADVFETSVLYSQAIPCWRAVKNAVRQVWKENGKKGWIGCHTAHQYKYGCCLYFTFASAQTDDMDMKIFLQIKTRAMEAMLRHTGNLTHHHGVGYEHVPWMTRFMGPGAMDLLFAIKKKIDPKNICNPGKLLPEPISKKATPEEVAQQKRKIMFDKVGLPGVVKSML